VKRRPDFLVIGAQKSASTFVQVCLADHPEVWMPRGETPYFEDPDYGTLDRGHLERVVAGRREAKVGVKRPSWIGCPEVPARITRDLPDARLVAVLRNPVERAVSAYFHFIRDGFLPLLPFDEGMTKVLDDRAFWKRYPRSDEIIRFGMYHHHLSMYEHFWRKDALLVLLHEDIVRDPMQSVRSLYRHLEVSEDHVPRSLGSRPQFVVYQPFRLRLLRTVASATSRYDSARRRRIGPKNPLAAAINAAYWRFDRSVVGRFVPRGRAEMSPSMRERLTDIYREDVTRLQDMLDRDLSAWLAPRGPRS
jgi:hypothetical protein